MRNVLTLSSLLYVSLFGLFFASGALAHEGGDRLSVGRVVPGGPADAAGLAAGDVVLRLAGAEVATIDGLRRVMDAHQPGDTVPLVVDRGGEEVELQLKFGARPDGRVSIGVSLEVPQEAAGDPGEPTEGTTECRAWIEKTYRIDTMLELLDLDLTAEYEELLACVARDTQRMASADAIRYCDNVFKVHCSAVDLLTEIGEAQVERCEGLIAESLGVEPRRHRSWQTCGQHKVYDAYASAGRASDAEACAAAFLEECGTNLDAAIAGDEAAADQRAFAACCAAESLGTQCSMIDESFSRGPCKEREICVSRETGEWLTCSALAE